MSAINLTPSSIISKDEIIEICKTDVEDYFAYNKDEINIQISERVSTALCVLENELNNFKEYIKNIKVKRTKIHASVVNCYLEKTVNPNPIFKYC